MSNPIPTCPPSEVRIGTSWFWDAFYPDFPASDGWQLALCFRGGTDLTVSGAPGIAADGDRFVVRITPSVAAALTVPGKYSLVGTVTRSGEVHEVERRHLLVLPAATAAVNTKTFNRRMLEAIEGAMLGGVGSSTEAKSITVNGRTIQYRDRAELETAHARYSYLVAIEENPDGRVTHSVVFSHA